MATEDHYRKLKEHIAALDLQQHTCLVYNDREEQITAIAHYLKIGLERGEQCIYIADENTADFVLKVLRRAGLHINSAVQSGALILATSGDTYMRLGRFDPDDTMSLMEELVTAALAQGYRGLRGAAEMTWALSAQLGCDRLLSYESAVNTMFERYPIVGLCQYNANRFNPQVIESLIDLHPVSIYDNTIKRNPTVRS